MLPLSLCHSLFLHHLSLPPAFFSCEISQSIKVPNDSSHRIDRCSLDVRRIASWTYDVCTRLFSRVELIIDSFARLVVRRGRTDGHAISSVASADQLLT